MEDLIVKSLLTVWLLWLSLCVAIMVKWPDGFYAPKWAVHVMAGFLISCAVSVIVGCLYAIWAS